jgi:hypothetical protein
MAPDVARIDALRLPVLASIRVARRRNLDTRIATVLWRLPVLWRLRIARRLNIAPLTVVVALLVVAGLRQRVVAERFTGRKSGQVRSDNLKFGGGRVGDRRAVSN